MKVYIDVFWFTWGFYKLVSLTKSTKQGIINRSTKFLGVIGKTTIAICDFE